MRNIRKFGQLINTMDDLKNICRGARLGATKSPDYAERVQPMEQKLNILADHLEDLQIELINLITED